MTMACTVDIDPDGVVNHDEEEEQCYDTAVSALLSPLHQSATPVAIRAAAARRKNTLHDMHTYLHRLGLNLNNNDVATDDGDGDAGNDDVAANSNSNNTNNNNTNNNIRLPSLIFHVTGTKGKGSTLSLCESILRNAYGLKTGMFTSPHLVDIRERIRINGIPVSKKVFGQVYWQVRRKLEHYSKHGDDDDAGALLPPLPVLPGYFRMLTLMALYTFCHYENPKIDAILLEVGVGGRYDATNVFEPQYTHLTPASSSLPKTTSPSSSMASQERLLVRGVTLIDYDHTRVLGSTLEQIAWEKGGIFVREKMKNIGMNNGGYDAFLKKDRTDEATKVVVEGQSSSPTMVFANGNNTPEVLLVLQQLSDEHGCRLQIVQDSYLESFPEIGLQGDHQRSNAALALSMCRYAMEEGRSKNNEASCQSLTTTISEEELKGALEKTFWPGRCHTVTLPSLLSDDGVEVSMNLRCDGAHTPISINACIDWFRNVVNVGASATTSPRAAADQQLQRVLIFNCSHERNPVPLLFSLYHSNLFHSVYFCKADFERPSAVPKRLDGDWTKESLANENFHDVLAVTVAGMCAEIATYSLLKDDGNTMVLDPTKLSASTWQETLANVWQVFDMHQRIPSGDHLSQSVINVTTGLNVKDALIAMQNEAATTINNGGVGAASEAEKVLIEVCITGSLYIVGSVLEAAGWKEEEAVGNIIC